MSHTVDRLTEIVTPPQSAGIEVFGSSQDASFLFSEHSPLPAATTT